MVIDMTIDEAITHAREVANEQRKDNDNCKYKSQYGCKDCADYYSKPCIECAEEHELLAEWLEELKDYRDKNKMVVRIDVENLEIVKDRAIELAKDQYNKAIEDFAEKVKEMYAFTILEEEKLNEIAEQLKAGVKYEM